MKNKKVAIIIPVHNSGIHLKAAVESIIQNTKYNYKLIIVESESTDGTAEYCDELAINYEGLVEVYHTKREGITKAINFGIKKAGELDIYLTQDDVIIPNLYKRDWLDIIVQVSKMDNCGAVTTIRAGGISGPTYLDGLRWTGTWSLFLPRKTINQIGLFDEKFSPGPGDDIDYSYRICKAGLYIYESNFWVDHHRMTENFNDQGDFIAKNAKYFRKKFKLGEFE